MKEKLMLFVMGVLVGAVISTTAFYVYTTTSNKGDSNIPTQMSGGNMPSMQNGNMGQPPEMPNSQNGQNNTQNNG